MKDTIQDASSLVQKWKPILDFEGDGVQPITESHKREVTARLLENQSQWLAEANLAGPGGVFGNTQDTFNGGFSGDHYAPGDSRVPKIVIPMVRRTFPELITNEIVGVQPMSGPVGLAFALRYKYLGDPLDQLHVNGNAYARPTGYAGTTGAAPSASGNYGDAETWWRDGAGGTAPAPSGVEAGYNFLDTRYTGAETSVFSAAAADTAATLTGSMSSLSGKVANIFSKQDMGIARLMSEFEMTGRIPQMSISIEKESVEAGTRRIAAHWSVELEQDLKAMNGIDIDQEMTQSLSYEIQAEIDREMLTRMIHICVKAGYANPGKGKGISFWDAGTADGRWLGERCRDFYAHVVVEANRMAVYNRRGPANFIVATPRVCALLEMLPDFKMFPVGSSVNTAQTGVAKVGQVGGRFTIYRDTRTEAQYDMGARSDALEYALLGYKGSEYYDTGIVFCPYIPVMMQRALDPNTFTPKIGLMTRYGVVDHIFGADMFYHLILVTGMGEPMATVATQQRVFL